MTGMKMLANMHSWPRYKRELALKTTDQLVDMIQGGELVLELNKNISERQMAKERWSFIKKETTLLMPTDPPTTAICYNYHTNKTLNYIQNKALFRLRYSLDDKRPDDKCTIA